jgi:hypothetical protein
MEPLSPKARALLASAQRSESPTPEFRARAHGAWQRNATALGLGAVAFTATTGAAAATSTLSTSATATSAGAIASGASAMSASAAQLSVFAFGGIFKFVATAGLVVAAGTGAYGTYLATGFGDEPRANVVEANEVRTAERVERSAQPTALPPPNVELAFGAPADTIPFASAPVETATADAAPMPPAGAMTSSERALASGRSREMRGAPLRAAPSATPLREAIVPLPLPLGSPAPVTSGESSALLEHARELERAHRLLREGSAESALELLEGSNIADAPGATSLAVERQALRIAAMCRLRDADKRAAGRVLALTFAAKHPNSPMLERLRSECSD